MDLMFAPLRKYAEFNGRARRSEYWLFYLFTIVLELAIFVLIGAGGAAQSGGVMSLGMILIIVLALGLFLPSLAVTVRRLHDSDKSGWWVLILLVPILGALVYLIFMVLDGTPGPNRYGPDPKARAALGAAAA